MTSLDFTNCNAFKSGHAERRMYLFMLVNSSTGYRCSCTFLAGYSRLMKLRALVSYPSPHRKALFVFLSSISLVSMNKNMRLRNANGKASRAFKHVGISILSLVNASLQCVLKQPAASTPGRATMARSLAVMEHVNSSSRNPDRFTHASA